MTTRMQVGIVGAGPAELMLGQLLHRHGIDSVIFENRSRDHVIECMRARVLERVELIREVARSPSTIGDKWPNSITSSARRPR